MATKNIVPRSTNEGQLGRSGKRWAQGNFVTASATYISGSLIPHAANTYDLGSASLYWKDIFISSGSLKFVNPATSAVIQEIKATSTGVVFQSGSGLVANISGSTISGSALHIQGDGKITGDFTLGGDITIGDANTDSLSISADLTSNLVPNTDNAYDFGSTTKRWRNIYLSGSVSSSGGPHYFNSDSTVGITAVTTLTAKGNGGASFGDDVGTWEFDGAGALSETGMTTVSITPSSTLDIDAGGAVTIDGSAITIGGDSDVAIDMDASTFDVDASGALTMTSTTMAFDPSSTFDLDAAGAITIDGSSITLGGDADTAFDIDTSTLDIDSSGAITIDGTSTVAIAGASTSTYGDDTAVWSFNGSGAVSETGMTTFSLTPSSTVDVDAAGAVTIDSSGAAITIGGDAVGQKVSVGGDVANRTEVELNAILVDINAGSGGITMDAGAASNLTTSGGTITVSGKTGVAIQEDGSDVIAIDTNRDVLFGQTGGSASDPDVEIDGYLKVDGSSTFGAPITASAAISSSGAMELASLTLDTDLAVAHGGTGASTLTDGGVLLGSGTGAVTAMAVLGDSEMIVGDGTTDPVAESGATLRTSIGVGTGDSPQFTSPYASTGVEIGHASDTTLTRASSGDVNIEGNIIYRAGGTDVPVADGGTGASTLTDGGVLLGSGTSAVTAMAVLADGEFIVGDGTTDPVAESGDTARVSLGVGTSDSPTFAGVDVNGSVTVTGNITGDHGSNNMTIASSNASVLVEGTTFAGNDVTIAGNLTVQGSETIISSSALNVVDKNITIGSGSITSAVMDEGGLDFGLPTIANIRYDHSLTAISSSVKFYAPNISGSLTGSFGRTSTTTLDLDSVIGNWTNAGNTIADLGSVTTCDINGGTINGITDLAVADGGTGASTLDNLITLSDHTTGNYVATLTGGTGITSTGATSGEGIVHSISVDASQTGVTALGTIATGVWEATDIEVAHGGTGASSLTDGAILLGSGTGAITALAMTGDGEMLVGDGTTDPVVESGATLRTSIGVGTGDSPTFAGSTNGAIQVGVTGDNEIDTSSGNLTIDSNGGTVTIDDHCTVTGTLTESSTAEIKKNITTLDSGLDKVLLMRGVEFDYKENDLHSIGVIAEEINKIEPYLLSEDKKSVQYTRIVPLLIEAIKDLSTKVDKQNKIIDKMGKN